MTDFIRMKGSQRVKMNLGEPKVSEVQAAAVHNLPKVRLQSYQAIVVRSVESKKTNL